MQQATRSIDDRGIIRRRHAARTDREDDAILHKNIGTAEEASRIQDEPSTDYQRSIYVVSFFIHVYLTRA
jgi:hypothetical protein